MAGSRDTTALAHFPTLCDQAFGPMLRSHGFRPADREVSSGYARRAYVNGARYIAATANLDPRDAPYYCGIELGEGKRDMPERDWNAVALWRLARDGAPERIPTGQDPYSIEGAADLAAVVPRMAADLSAYADDFLRGDVVRFRRVRAEQTREREPYTIWEPDEGGSYVSRPDPVSSALKARFSQAE